MSSRSRFPIWETALNTLVFLLALALIALAAFFGLLVATVQLARAGQAVGAALTGAGAVAIGIVGLYKLLMLLGQTA